MRQYYGKNLSKNKDGNYVRIAYRCNSSIPSEGSDPLKLVVKPFSSDMECLSDYFYNLLKIRMDDLQLYDCDLSKPFNSCTVLLYHSIKGYKKQSSMGWHCDSKYSISGKFLEKSNGQAFNTPVVIFTVGARRFLYWRRRWKQRSEKGYNRWAIDKNSIQFMTLDDASVCIINPMDERCHLNPITGLEEQLQHGNTKIKGDDISVCLVFRVSPHICICDKKTNRVILPSDLITDTEKKERNSKVNYTNRQQLYMNFDKDQYHNTLKCHFYNYFF